MSWYEFLLFVHIAMAVLWVVFLIIFDMSMKPSWGDASLWITVLAFAALAALLVRSGVSARLAAAPAAE